MPCNYPRNKKPKATKIKKPKKADLKRIYGKGFKK